MVLEVTLGVVAGLALILAMIAGDDARKALTRAQDAIGRIDNHLRVYKVGVEATVDAVSVHSQQIKELRQMLDAQAHLSTDVVMLGNELKKLLVCNEDMRSVNGGLQNQAYRISASFSDLDKRVDNLGAELRSSFQNLDARVSDLEKGAASGSRLPPTRGNSPVLRARKSDSKAPEPPTGIRVPPPARS